MRKHDKEIIDLTKSPNPPDVVELLDEDEDDDRVIETELPPQCPLGWACSISAGDAHFAHFSHPRGLLRSRGALPTTTITFAEQRHRDQRQLEEALRQSIASERAEAARKQIRTDQDREYRRSLRKDRKRQKSIEKAKESEQEKEKQLQASLEARRAYLKDRFEKELDKGVSVTIQIPGASRVTRTFGTDECVEAVRAYVEYLHHFQGHNLFPSMFDLIVLPNMSLQDDQRLDSLGTRLLIYLVPHGSQYQ